MIGNLIISKAGHDKGMRYIIIEEEGDFAYLADGKSRRLEKPKKKRKKHIQPVTHYDTSEVAKKLLNHEKISNEEIKRIIKLSLLKEKNEEE